MSRTLISLALGFIVLLAAAIAPGSSSAASERSWPGTYTMRLGDRGISVEIANTDEERIRGLSGRRDLAAGSGLLFVFPNEATYGFWMKEMNFAIDILWISADLKVIHIAEDVAPETYPKVFRPSQPARYVLELKAMSARKLGVQVGTPVTLPAVLKP